MNIIGNNSIVIGNDNSKNPIFESIIIGKNNFQNNYSKNSLIIGNNNSTDITNKHQIIIGNNIHNKYLLNIDNTILRDSNKILIGIEEIPVAIGYNSNDIIDLSDKNSLYVKNGIVLSNITLQNSNYFKTSINIPQTLTSNITYTLPIIPNEFSRILLTTDNRGNLKWTETSTFDLNTNLNISNLYSSNIYVSGYIFGDGTYLSNVNIEKKGVLTLKSGNSYRFKFSNGKWEFYAPETANFTPEKNGNTIPVFQQSQAQYVVSDAAWTETIHLPQTGQNGQILVVKSNALKSSKINSQNALFPSTLVVNKNDAYIFQYNQELSKWVPLSVPTRIINVINALINASHGSIKYSQA
jgi:hypothetical protein